jgi:hypothetical protein
MYSLTCCRAYIQVAAQNYQVPRIHCVIVSKIKIKSNNLSVSSITTVKLILHNYIHTYHSRFIPEGVAEAFQIFFRVAHVLPKLVSYEEHCRRAVIKYVIANWYGQQHVTLYTCSSILVLMPLK